jgi:hypothetical protein
VDAQALLDALLVLASELGVRVEELPGQAPLEGLSPTGSGLCRVSGRNWVLLSPAEPLERRIEVLCEALRELAADALCERYLPPAVRERVFPGVSEST